MEKDRPTQPQVSIAVSFQVKMPSMYSHTKLLNIHLTDEPVPTDADPMKYLVSRLNEEIKRQAPLVKEAYTPVPKVERLENETVEVPF